MESFCISSCILGSEKNVVVSDDGFLSSLKTPKDVWLLNGAIDPMKPLCLDSLFKLGNVDIDLLPNKKWLTAMDFLTKSSNLPWNMILPKEEYKLFVKNLVNTVKETIDSLPKNYYREVWCPAGQFLSTLRPARVDSDRYKSFVEQSERDSGALETFRPGPGGFLQKVVYDRFSTRTGRLTVSSGPNILTLKKEHRKLLKSNFPNGSICSLDFSALEARIILAEAGVEVGQQDLYSSISEELFHGKIERDVVKIAVISELYGSSKHALGARLGLSGKKLDEFINLMQGHFKTSELRKRLKNEFIETGKIRNKHGRHLELDDPQDHLFVNTYAQSTGVDVSLLGFKSVVDILGEDGIRPLFVLHDALILDVREDRLKDVEAIRSTSVPGYVNEFPLKFERL